MAVRARLRIESKQAGRAVEAAAGLRMRPYDGPLGLLIAEMARSTSLGRLRRIRLAEAYLLRAVEIAPPITARAAPIQTRFTNGISFTKIA